MELISLALLLAIAVLMIVLLLRRRAAEPADLAPLLREELRAGRGEAAAAARELREEIARSQHESTASLADTLTKLGEGQNQRLDGVTRQLKSLSESNEERLDKLRKTVDAQLSQLREANVKKLDEMRKTVDEQLQGTLEKRLGESFKVVSERLEAVHRGLGEMHKLATGVGDLKRVLTNVKTRGTWGEVQLGALLEQVLTANQYEYNVAPKPDSTERVEYAIKLPGRDADPGTVVWLPIDAKFPQEAYLRLVEASEIGDPETVRKAGAELVRAVEVSAADIHAKYIAPPHTTDFGIMFLPTEGLYAEIARQPEVLDRLQRTHRVVPAGPTTLAAILNSLQMGFRTLAIERRSSEVWTVLSAVKTEFGKFGEVLSRVKKQLETASNSIEKTGVRSRAIERKLRDVEELPGGEGAKLLDLPPQPGGEPASEEQPSPTAGTD